MIFNCLIVITFGLIVDVNGRKLTRIVQLNTQKGTLFCSLQSNIIVILKNYFQTKLYLWNQKLHNSRCDLALYFLLLLFVPIFVIILSSVLYKYPPTYTSVEILI